MENSRDHVIDARNHSAPSFAKMAGIKQEAGEIVKIQSCKHHAISIVASFAILMIRFIGITFTKREVLKDRYIITTESGNIFMSAERQRYALILAIEFKLTKGYPPCTFQVV